MSFEFGTGVNAGNTWQTTWTWWPEDTLEGLDLMLCYFGLSKGCVRPRKVATTRKDSQQIAKMCRCLHDKAIKSAVALIHPGRRCPEKRALHWYVTPTMDIKGRLASAGIDIDTCLVTDERRWAFAWQQLTCTPYKISYALGENERLVKSELPTPAVEPVVKHVTTMWTPGSGQPAKTKLALERRNNYVWKNGKRIYQTGEETVKQAVEYDISKEQKPEL